MNWLTRLLKSEEDPAYEPGPAPPVGPELERDHAQILADLVEAGLVIGDLGDLMQDMDYREQVPILAGWLGRTENLVLKDLLVRSLSVPWAKPAADALLAELGRFDLPWEYRWQVGNALYELKDRSLGERLVPLLEDPRQDRGAEMALIALGRTKYPPALDVLVAKLQDPGVVGHAADGLGQLGDPAAIPALERVEDDRDWVRSEVARAIRKLEKQRGAAT